MILGKDIIKQTIYKGSVIICPLSNYNYSRIGIAYNLTEFGNLLYIPIYQFSNISALMYQMGERIKNPKFDISRPVTYYNEEYIGQFGRTELIQTRCNIVFVAPEELGKVVCNYFDAIRKYIPCGT